MDLLSTTKNFLRLLTLTHLWLSVNTQTVISSDDWYWGDWHPWDHCPRGLVAQAFQIRNLVYQGPDTDDGGMTAIRLFCGDPNQSYTPSITSGVGKFGGFGETGGWQNVHNCYPGHITAFQMKQQTPQGGGSYCKEKCDDTASTNIRFFCTTTSKFVEAETYNPNNPKNQDSWRTEKYCPSGEFICGIQTQIEPYQGPSEDDTMLGSVNFCCCRPGWTTPCT